ncbi:MAG TPA: TetR/AcrR family transcriptional regulator [Xanthobacteraceae bacterium]|nr:TetR/AcrR family transcriptional regulator [Xanthobacteraceae bacterium]
MEQETRSRGGRPWSFDRDKAVEIAMRLFWRHGYEGVSVDDLTKAIGIAPPSLYAAFGSKAGLYREALARYEQTLDAPDIARVGAAPTLAQAVRLLLEGAIKVLTHPDREPGCMITNSMLTCHAAHAALAREAADRREAMREKVAQALAPFGKPQEIAPLTRCVFAVMQGMSIQARDGATPAQLQEIVEEVVSGMAARIGRKRSSRRASTRRRTKRSGADGTRNQRKIN